MRLIQLITNRKIPPKIIIPISQQLFINILVFNSLYLDFGEVCVPLTVPIQPEVSI